MLMKLWCFFISGCIHKWDIINKGNIVNDDNVFVGKYFYLKCEKCGNLKKKQFYCD